MIGGFVERVGFPGPMVASDGTTHDATRLLVQAVDAMIGAAGAEAASMKLTIAVPAHWDSSIRREFQDALDTHGGLSTLGGPARLVSDARAALATLESAISLPDSGVVALMDFGSSGTSITLADAGRGFRPVDETLRYRGFSGDRLDDALLAHVLDSVGHGSGAGSGVTAAVAQLTELRAEANRAKELLSVKPVADLVADLRGSQLSVRVTRAEFEALIEDSLSGLMSAFGDLLEGNMIRRSQLSAVALSGGGASIPLIAKRLSAAHRVPTLLSQHPSFDMALGATQMAEGMADEEATTRTALAGEESQARTALAVAVGSAAGGMTGFSGGGLDDLGPTALAEPELAWSQEEIRFGDEPVAYDGDDYTGSIDIKPAAPYQVPSRLPERRRRSGTPRLVVGMGALAAMVAVGGVGYRLTSATDTPEPVEKPVSSSLAPPPAQSNALLPAAPVEPPPIEAPPEVPNVNSSPEPVVVAPPPPVVVTTPPPVHVTTTTPSPTPTTTATTPSPTPTTTTTTSPPPTTSTSTSSQVPMTTGYLTLPFVPVPIPIQVPQNQVPQNQAPPQNPYIGQPGSTGLYP